jgi:hypothetical protein
MLNDGDLKPEEWVRGRMGEEVRFLRTFHERPKILSQSDRYMGIVRFNVIVFFDLGKR